jgi:hypothetical protein
MIDYVGAAVNESTKGDDQRLRINCAGRSFTTVAKQERCACILFSQITPPKDGGSLLYSLRDSKDLSNAAEVVLIGRYSGEGDHAHKTRSLVLAKNKPGPEPAGGEFEMGTNADLQAFRPVEAGGEDWLEDDYV